MPLPFRIPAFTGEILNGKLYFYSEEYSETCQTSMLILLWMHSLVISYLCSETKGSRFDSDYWLCLLNLHGVKVSSPQ